MAVPLLHNDYGSGPPARVGLSHPSIAPYGEFRLADARGIVLAVQNQREWRALCDLLDDSLLASDPRFIDNVTRCARRADLDAAIEAALRRFDPDAVGDRLKAAGIAFGFLNTVSAFSGHPQLRRVTVDTATGSAELPAPPVRWNGRSQARLSVPAVDEQGSAIRVEFQ